MRSLILLAFFFFITGNSFAQHQYIHQEQSNYYNQFSHFSEQQFDSLRGKSTQNLNFKNQKSAKQQSCNLTKTVFGWHPYWVGSAYNNYQWNLLSDLSYFSYEVDVSTGNALTTHNWSTAAVVDSALANGLRVNLCVTLFSSHATFFGNSTAQQTLITNLINLVQSRGGHGVNIDFEGVPSSQKIAFNNFVVDLCNQMHAAIPGSQVSIALFSVDWNGVFDIPLLNNYIDLFIIMGYGYYWTGSTTAGPTDPLYHFGTTYNYTLSRSITYYLNEGTTPSKLALGLPYYGREYTTTSNAVPSSVLNPPNSAVRFFDQIKDNASGNYVASNKYWEGDSFTPYFMFQSGGNWKQSFINDGYSLQKRLEFVNQRGIAGIGIWALGYDDGYTDYWDAIRDKFTDCAIVPCNDTIYDMGGPNKDYYDDEDWTYTIAPDGASSVTLSFSSFDVELNYDTLWLYDGNSTASPLIGAYTGTNSPGTVTSSGPEMTLRFWSDAATNNPGWEATWTCSIASVPVANFSTSALAVCMSDSVSFVNTSSDATSYEWTFPGGSPASSNLANPSILFNSSGTYSVTLIATGLGGSDTIVQNITVSVSQLPTSNFQTSDTLLQLPASTAAFTNNSINASNYLWSFGDSSTSSAQAPIHTYIDTGWFSVMLIASNGLCPDDTLLLNNYIYVADSVSAPPSPLAGFSYSSTEICLGDSVQFTNTSIYADTYQWIFEFASPPFSTNENPAIIYISSGSFEVTLIVSGQGGTDTLSQTINVTINTPPIAAFVASDTILLMPNTTATFTNNSINADSYQWDFDDASTSSAQNPWHQYNDTGTYAVVLIAGNECGNDTATINIYVENSTNIQQQATSSRLHIFPNPNSGVFELQFGTVALPSLNMTIYNVFGEKIHYQIIKSPNQLIDISSYPKGIYFLQLQNDEFVHSSKIVVR